MLGRDVLVAPVIEEGAVKRTCYLPKDGWIHLFTGVEYEGGNVTVDAPIGCPPVFVRTSAERKAELLLLAKSN